MTFSWSNSKTIWKRKILVEMFLLYLLEENFPSLFSLSHCFLISIKNQVWKNIFLTASFLDYQYSLFLVSGLFIAIFPFSRFEHLMYSSRKMLTFLSNFWFPWEDLVQHWNVIGNIYSHGPVSPFETNNRWGSPLKYTGTIPGYYFE